eukprot:770505_1
MENSSLLSINLKHLASPYELSQLILQLPHYKPSNIKDNNDHDDDLVICQKLAVFMYTERLTGKYFMSNTFTKRDFDNMMVIVNDTKCNCEWIWQIILKLRNNNTNIKSSHKN